MKNLSYVLKPVLAVACLTLAWSAVAGDKCCKKKSNAAETNSPPTQVAPGKTVK